MSHIPRVTVVDSLDYLSPEEFRLQLWHLTIRFHLEVAMETASIDVLHDEEHLLL